MNFKKLKCFILIIFSVVIFSMANSAEQSDTWNIKIEGILENPAGIPKIISSHEGNKSVILKVKVRAAEKNQSFCGKKITIINQQKKSWPLIAVSTNINKDYSILRLEDFKKGSLMQLIAAGKTVLSGTLAIDEKTLKPCRRITLSEKESEIYLVFFIPTKAVASKLNFGGQILVFPKK